MKFLLLVDIQKDFCPSGSLAVEGGNDIVPIANDLMRSGYYDRVVASKDWHPENHGSFASSHQGKKPFDMGELSGRPQVMWPDHCVQGSANAEFHDDLNLAFVNLVQTKGENPDIDSYSAFKDNAGDALTGLHNYLLGLGVTQIDICGLATDYCVRFTAEDAVDLLPGAKVRFISDASRGISPDGIEAALASMSAKGVEIITSAEVLTR
jgi:nicotinamidase/pyrazinamidase